MQQLRVRLFRFRRHEILQMSRENLRVEFVGVREQGNGRGRFLGEGAKTREDQTKSDDKCQVHFHNKTRRTHESSQMRTETSI